MPKSKVEKKVEKIEESVLDVTDCKCGEEIKTMEEYLVTAKELIVVHDDEINDMWTTADGGPCLTFNQADNHKIVFPTIDISEFFTGTSTTTGAFTCCFWFRTGHDYSSGNNGAMFAIENYSFAVAFENGYLTAYASGNPTNTEYIRVTNGGTTYNDDNWHFVCTVWNNTASTIGDTAVNKALIYVDDMIDDVTSTTYDDIDSDFVFDSTIINLTIGQFIGPSWFFEGELGPIMFYGDYCLNEEERIINYNYHRHRYYDTAIG